LDFSRGITVSLWAALLASSKPQLLQLFMTLCASAVLLGERLDTRAAVYGIVVVIVAAVGTRLRARQQNTAVAKVAAT
jgi:magnesium-transporting ATPase (P-type)